MEMEAPSRGLPEPGSSPKSFRIFRRLGIGSFGVQGFPAALKKHGRSDELRAIGIVPDVVEKGIQA
jgi:hypothetical protein